MRKFYLLLIILGLALSFSSWGDKQSTLYVVPIDGQIGPALEVFVDEKIKEIDAKNENSTIIFHINTPGGRIDSAEAISNSILDSQSRTVAFIDRNAQSAGVLISISAQSIYMTQGSSIGSASTIPETEKAMSYWLGVLRRVSKLNGYDSEIVSAMADKDMVIPGLVEKGKLLNLDYIQAEELGLSSGTVSSINELVEKLGHKGSIVFVEENSRVKLAKLVTNVTFSSFLLIIGIGGFVAEIFVSGFGLAGTLSLVAFSLYFGGGLLAGSSGWGVILIFIAGAILLLIEVVIPGFGIPGIAGILCILASIVMSAPTISQGLTLLAVALVFLTILIVLLAKYMPKNRLFGKLILRDTESKDLGYVGTIKKEEYLGLEGSTITTLRPSGSGEFNGIKLDIIAEGEYISSNRPIKIVRIEGMRVVVKEIK